MAENVNAKDKELNLEGTYDIHTDINPSNYKNFLKAFRCYVNLCEKDSKEKNSEEAIKAGVIAVDIYKKIFEYIKKNKLACKKDLQAVERHFSDPKDTLKNRDFGDLERIKGLNRSLGIALSIKAGKLNDANNFREALPFASQAVIYHSKDVFTNYELGRSLRGLGAKKEAADSFEKVLELDKNYTYGRRILGELYGSEDIQEVDKAIENYHEYLQKYTEDAWAWGEYARHCYTLGIQDICDMACMKSFNLNPTEYTLLETYLLNLLKMSKYSQQDVKRITEKVMNKCLKAQNIEKCTYTFDQSRKDPNKKLKIGYISSDLNSHVVSKFLLPVIENHDKEKYDFYLFSIVKQDDHVTEKYKKCVKNFIRCIDMTRDELCNKIYELQIDILIDLNIHTGNSRILALAPKPAPVQAVWLGYPNTSGLDTVDYILTDKDTIHPDEEEFYTEKPMYIDAGYEVFYVDESSIPAPTPAPYHKNKYITFGVFNAVAKVNDKMIKVWAEILKRVKNSKILFQYTNAYTKQNQERFWRRFEAHGIPRKRVMFINDPKTSHFQSFMKADIAFDTHPYSGTGTTIDSLLIGLPIICLAGYNSTSRPTSRMLRSIHRSELIAYDESEYIEKAVALAKNPKRIDEYRRTLKSSLNGSRLTDYKGFSRSLEKCFDRMWAEYCAK